MEEYHHLLYDHRQEIAQWPNYPLIYENQPPQPSIPSPNRLHDQLTQAADLELDDQEEELGAAKEMAFRIAAMRPVDNIDPDTIRKRKRRNVHISDDPQSVAARRRRERVSEKIRILQRLVPGGTKMDIGSMLEEAVRYVKFLKRQILLLQGLDCHLHHQTVAPVYRLQPEFGRRTAETSYDMFGGI